MKYLKALLIVALVVSCAVSANLFAPSIEAARETVVKIANEQGMGAGVIINENGTIVTNAHVVGESKKVEVTTKDGKVREGWVLWTSSAYDVALVKVAAKHLPSASLLCAIPSVGDAVFAVGHPLGAEWSVTFGHISAIRGADLQTDTNVLPGNSGGGLFDARGRLVGLPRGMRLLTLGFGVSPSGQNYAVSSDTICYLLNRN